MKVENVKRLLLSYLYYAILSFRRTFVISTRFCKFKSHPLLLAILHTQDKSEIV